MLKYAFFLKNCKNCRVLELRPSDPLASGGWGLCPRPPASDGFLRLGDPPQTPGLAPL